MARDLTMVAPIDVRRVSPLGGATNASPGAVPHPYADFLGSVEKPGRYLGGEENCVIKSDLEALTCRFVLAFPDSKLAKKARKKIAELQSEESGG